MHTDVSKLGDEWAGAQAPEPTEEIDRLRWALAFWKAEAKRLAPPGMYEGDGYASEGSGAQAPHPDSGILEIRRIEGAQANPTEPPEDKAAFERFRKRADKARNFPTQTDPCSRHAYIIADCLTKKGGYPMLAEEPVHCAESIMAVVAMLWEARDALSGEQASPTGWAVLGKGGENVFGQLHPEPMGPEFIAAADTQLPDTAPHRNAALYAGAQASPNTGEQG